MPSLPSSHSSIPSQIVFYLPTWIRITYTILAGVVAILSPTLFLFAVRILVSMLVGGNSWANLFLIPIVLVCIMMVAMFLLAFRLFGHTKTMLIMSHRGVVFDSFWEKVETSWENIDRIATIPMGGVASEAFLLKTSVPVVYRWGKFPFIRIQPVNIPLSGFGRSYGDDPFASALRTYAPDYLQAR